MKILSVGSVPSSAPLQKSRPISNSSVSAPSKGDSVSIGSFASQLSALESAAKSAPVVNAEKVAAIREAIASGQFSINPDAIADAVINSARELLAGRNG